MSACKTFCVSYHVRHSYQAVVEAESPETAADIVYALILQGQAVEGSVTTWTMQDIDDVAQVGS